MMLPCWVTVSGEQSSEAAAASAPTRQCVADSCAMADSRSPRGSVSAMPGGWGRLAALPAADAQGTLSERREGPTTSS